jgi:hypothetical protein
MFAASSNGDCTKPLRGRKSPDGEASRLAASDQEVLRLRTLRRRKIDGLIGSLTLNTLKGVIQIKCNLSNCRRLARYLLAYGSSENLDVTTDRARRDCAGDVVLPSVCRSRILPAKAYHAPLDPTGNAP